MNASFQTTRLDFDTLDASAADAEALELEGSTVPLAVITLLERLLVPTPILFSWLSGVSNLFFLTTPFQVFEDSFKNLTKFLAHLKRF